MSTQSSIITNAPQKAIDRIRSQTDQQRTQFILDVFIKYFADGIRKSPSGFHRRFTKMALSPVNFYRGSALLFYQDLKIDQDQWITSHPPAGKIFIHGDLHAQNFGSYIDNQGKLTFDANDFDEGYCGPFTWDLKRLLSSLNLIGYSKGFSDPEIQRILHTCINAYIRQVDEFCKQKNTHFSLTLKNTTGKIKDILNKTRLKSNIEHLNALTTIENYDRKLSRSKTRQDIVANLRPQLLQAFGNYLKTIPASKKNEKINYRIKDMITQPTPGVGSAGKISFEILLEGPTEALENDIVLYMKPAQKSAVSYVIQNPEIEKYFQHDGLRTVLCSYAMQAATPKWLGYTTIGNVSYLIDQSTPHREDLEWENITELNDILEVVTYLGQTTAKIHCVADSDCVNTPNDVACLPFSIIPKHTEKTIRQAIGTRTQEFIQELVQFGMVYGKLVRRDHHLFFEAFRNKQIPGLQ